MKKMLSLFAVMALLLAACGSSDDPADEAAPADDGAAVDDVAEDDAEDADSDEADSGGEESAGEDESAGEKPDADSDTVDLTQGSDLTFHMVTHSDDGPFWSVVKRGAEAAADDLGVEMVWLGSNNNPESQVQLIEQAVAEGSDGIAASLPSPDQLIGPLQSAVEAGIPVITLNSGANDYQAIGALTHVGQTEIIAGNGAAARFDDLGTTKILCGLHEQSNVALEERCQGLTEAFSGEVITEFMGLDADQTEQQNTISSALQADPDIDGFLGGPVIAMSALRAAQDLGRDMDIAAFDITPELIEAIKAGDVAFTVDQQQYLQGYMPVLLLYLNVTNLNTLGGGLPILTGPGFVTPDNAANVEELVAQGTR